MKWLLINGVFIFSTLLLFAKNECVFIVKVVDKDKNPISNCRIILPEPRKVAFTNKNGKVEFIVPKLESIKIKIEKFLYSPIDTTISFPIESDTFFVQFMLNEKEFLSKEVVITATRTEKELISIAMPISTYAKEEIKLVNAKRLDELLLELTEIPLVDDHGRGIQLQGLDPDYTLLLVNGEPIVNRTGGILDISRLSVGNVSRIEVVRGPNSSIFGSNALAGVVNIITEEPQNQTEASFYSKYGTFNTFDLIGELKKILLNDRLSLTLFGHRYKTDGFKLNPTSVGKTVPTIAYNTFQVETFLTVTPKSKVRFSFRGNFEEEINNYLAGSDTIFSKNDVKDISSYLFYKNTLSERFNYEFRTYFSTFETYTNDKFLKNNQTFDEYKFSQNLFKVELQTNYLVTTNQYLTIGGGVWTEEAKSVRISGGKERNLLFYLYAQDDITLFNNLNLIGSIRIDDHSDYPIQLSPKFSASYQILPNLVLRTSVGTGFKAPNFEELYLNWTNPMAGYSVFGRTYVFEGVRKLQEQGQIAILLISPDSLPTLEPEKSFSLDFGLNYSVNKLFLKLNIFRNNVTNLIDFLPVAIKTNGQRLHTYQNLRKIFTQGVEVSIEYQILEHLKANISYQFLTTGDVDIINKIKSGKIFKRDQQGNDIRVSLSDYGGLFHRPTHSANIRLTYYNHELKLYSTLRANVKGKFGFKDVNGNLILDDNREYAPGYAIFNWNISKEFLNFFTISFGVNNILDKKDTRLLAIYPGRNVYVSINLNYVQN